MSWLARLLGWGPQPADVLLVTPKPAPVAPQPGPGQYAPPPVPVLTVGEGASKPAPATPVLTLAVPLIQHFEACKLAPYLDAKGIPTIGWGNTRWKDGSAVRMADHSISLIEADDLFAWWLAKFDAGVVAMLPAGADPGTHAAFLSFAYNVGLAGAENSTALKRLHAGDKPGAAAGLALWNKSGGKVLKGLQRRRHAEGLVMQGASVKAAIIKAEAAFP